MMISASYYLVSKKHGQVKTLLWVQCQNGDVPAGAVEVGRFGGRGGEFMYVGRVALPSNDVIPGTVIPGLNACFAAWNGQEFAVKNYEVLVNSQPDITHLHWASPTAERQIPGDAVKAGFDAYNEQPVFVARARPPGVLGTHAGGIRHGDGVVRIAYSGVEHQIDDYKVLCKKILSNAEQQSLSNGNAANPGNKPGNNSNNTNNNSSS